MTPAEWQMLAGGTIFVAFLGAWHIAGILAVKKFRYAGGTYLSVLSAFIGLLILHLTEITLCALLLMFVANLPSAGRLEGFDGGLGEAIYFAGINFATLGYTQIEAFGAIRLLVMLQSLAGFMLITWSASFAYTLWNENFRDAT